MSTIAKRAGYLIVGIAAILLVAAAFQPIQCWAATYPENEGLTEQEVQDRFREINSTYDIGEAFNASDAEFVLTYGINPDSPSTRDSKYFHTSGTGSGTTVQASGTLYHNGTFNYTYGGNITISKSNGPTPRNLKLTVHCTAYGPVGSGGVGIIYNDGVSTSEANSAYFSASPSRTYSGVMTVYSLEAWVDVTTASGNMFTIR